MWITLNWWCIYFYATCDPILHQQIRGYYVNQIDEISLTYIGVGPYQVILPKYLFLCQMNYLWWFQ